MWTDEELKQALNEVSGGLDKLSDPKKPLTKEERKDRGRLLKRKYILERIKEAKEKKQKGEEVYNSAVYEMLVSWGERHPFLMSIMMHLMRIKWTSGLSPLAFKESTERKRDNTDAESERGPV